MLRTKQDIENAKVAVKKFDSDLHKKLNQVFKLAVQLAKKPVEVNVQIWHHGIMFHGFGIDISSPFHRVRLELYEWEHFDYDGGENIIDYYKNQIAIIERWLELMRKEHKS